MDLKTKFYEVFSQIRAAGDYATGRRFEDLPESVRRRYGLDFKYLHSAEELYVSDQLSQYLLSMEAKIEHAHPPFTCVLVHTRINVPATDNEILGILVYDMALIKEVPEEIKRELTMPLLAYIKDKRTGLQWLVQGKAYQKDTELIAHNAMEKQIGELCADYILSLFNFIQHPEVTIVNSEAPRRSLRGPSQSRKNYTVSWSGTVRRYIYEFNHKLKTAAKEGKYIMVRKGCYRHYRSEYFVNKKGSVDFIHSYPVYTDREPNRLYLAKATQETQWQNENYLRELVQKMFPDRKVIKTRKVLEPYEIDVFLPDLNLGFEYDGEQHHVYPNWLHKTEEEFQEQQRRDRAKDQMAKEKGIALIRIRYDEDLTAGLLHERIQSFRDRSKLSNHSP